MARPRILDITPEEFEQRANAYFNAVEAGEIKRVGWVHYYPRTSCGGESRGDAAASALSRVLQDAARPAVRYDPAAHAAVWA